MAKADIIKFLSLLLAVLKMGTVNRTKLNKLLFFIDLINFIKFGNTLSGANYIKMQYGPVPERMEEMRRVLINMEIIEEIETPHEYVYDYTYNLKKDGQLDNYINSKLRPDEIQLINNVTTKLSNYSANVLSSITHDFEPWVSASWFGKLDFKKANEDKALIKWLKENIDPSLNQN